MIHVKEKKFFWLHHSFFFVSEKKTCQKEQFFLASSFITPIFCESRSIKSWLKDMPMHDLTFVWCSDLFANGRPRCKPDRDHYGQSWINQATKRLHNHDDDDDDGGDDDDDDDDYDDYDDSDDDDDDDDHVSNALYVYNLYTQQNLAQ